MKKYLLLIWLFCCVGLMAMAQSTRIRLCTEQEIPMDIRNNYREKGKTVIENFYSSLPFCLENPAIKEELLQNYLTKSGLGFNQDFMEFQKQDLTPIEPEEYLQKFCRQYSKYDASDLKVEISNLFYDEDFYSNSLLNCYIIAYYEIKVMVKDKLLYTGRSKATCLFPNASNWMELKISGIYPLNDELGTNGEYAEYVKGFLKGPKDDDTLLMDAIEHMLYKEYDKALAIFNQLAKKGNPVAIYYLGDCYENGYGVQKDVKKAFKQYSKAADMDSDIGLYAMGNCYEYGIGVEKNDVKAFQYYKKAGERNYMPAYSSLGKCYEMGIGTAKDITQAVKWYTLGAEEHNVGAQFALGCLLLFGEEVKQDIPQALKWLERAAMQGHESSCYILGTCLFEGQYVEQDKEQAYKLFEYAARKGSPHAQFMIGLCHEFGEGTAKDIIQAVKWYTMAAEQDLVKAQTNLGVLYYINSEYPKALEWLMKAAKQKERRALYMVGECYYYGKGVGKNMVNAVQYYMESATLGYKSAQYALGYCYQHGQGVPFVDLKKAKEWYFKAAEQGHPDAVKALETMK